MDMPGRTTPPPGSIGQYRYGMNGQMKEGDVFEGFMSADFWGYDARLGRRWEMDPLVYDDQSPYACFNNNPIYFADPNGLEAQAEGEGGPKLPENGKNGDTFHFTDTKGKTTDYEFVEGVGWTLSEVAISHQAGKKISSTGIKYSDLTPLRIITHSSPNQKYEARLAGMANSFSSNQVMGYGRVDPRELYSDPELQIEFAKGQLVGDVASMVQGEMEVMAGQSATVWGSSLMLSGVGTLPGAALVVSGQIAVIHGAAVTTVATANMARTSAILMMTVHGHHSDPKAYGGDKDQPLTDMPEQEHRNLHSKMRDHMNNVNPKLNWKRGWGGSKIRQTFTRKYILQQLANFYKVIEKQNPYFKKAATDFFKQHPDLK